MIKKLCKLFFLLLFAAGLKAHPLKMAYTAVKYNPQKQVFEISHRVFQDDFEATLQSNYGYSGGDVYRNRSTAATQKTINTFFQKNFTFSVNGRPLKTRYTHMEQKGQMGIIVHYETEKISAADIRTISIYNYIMMESFREQVNMFSLNINGHKRTLRFDTGHVRETMAL